MNMTLNRLKNFRTILSEKNIEAMLISQAENRYYLSGFNSSAGYLLITQDRQLLATDFRYVEQAKQQSPEYHLFEARGDMAKWFPEFIADEYQIGCLRGRGSHLRPVQQAEGNTGSLRHGIETFERAGGNTARR
jgi:Xaa-Pro aminopeptidase